MHVHAHHGQLGLMQSSDIPMTLSDIIPSTYIAYASMCSDIVTYFGVRTIASYVWPNSHNIPSNGNQMLSYAPQILLTQLAYIP